MAEMEEQFMNWAKALTKGSSFSWHKEGLTKEHFELLLKVKSFRPVADQLMRRICPLDERRKIRRNISYASLQKNLIENNSHGDKGLNSLASAVEDARKELAAEAKGLRILIEEESRLTKRENELKCRNELLNAAIEEREMSLQKITPWISAVNHLLPEFSSSSSPQEQSLKQAMANNDLKLILERLQELKMRQLQSQDQNFHEEKVAMWQNVERLMERHSPSSLIKALVMNAAKGTANVNKAAQRLDLAEDAKALRLQYTSNGEFVDEMRPLGVFESVEAMLVQMSGKHVALHFNNYKKRQDIRGMDQLLSNMRETAHTTIKDLCNGDVSLESELLSLYDLTVHVAGLKASLEEAVVVGRRLNERAAAAQRAREQITQKYETIRQFNEKVAKGVTEVKTLALGLALSQQELEKEKDEIVSVVEEAMHDLHIPKPLKGSLSQEIDTMLDVPFQSLRLGTASSACPEFGDAATEGISDLVPYLTTWDNILETIRIRKRYYAQDKDILANATLFHDILLNTFRKKDLSLQRIKELHESVKSHDSFVEKSVVPLLDTCEETHSAMKLKMKQLEEVTEKWWTQPGPAIKDYLKNEQSL